MKRAVVVLPTYNERENVPAVVERVIPIREVVRPTDLQVLFVDDSSPDGTGEVIRELTRKHQFVHLLTRNGKLGLGTAYSDGFRYAMEALGAEILLEMDADLQHPPEKIPELIKKVDEGYDLVIASRNVEGGGQRGWSRRRVVVSKGANWLARSLLRLRVRDVTSGFRGLSVRAARELVNSRLSSSGFSFQLEAIQTLKGKGMKITEIPFIFEKRTLGRSKLSGSEVWSFLKTVVRLRFAR